MPLSPYPTPPLPFFLSSRTPQVLNITFRTTTEDLFPMFDRYGKVTPRPSRREDPEFVRSFGAFGIHHPPGAWNPLRHSWVPVAADARSPASASRPSVRLPRERRRRGPAAAKGGAEGLPAPARGDR